MASNAWVARAAVSGTSLLAPVEQPAALRIEISKHGRLRALSSLLVGAGEARQRGRRRRATQRRHRRAARHVRNERRDASGHATEGAPSSSEGRRDRSLSYLLVLRESNP